MPYGRPANVRSHRRGGPRKRMPVAPWIIVVLLTTAVMAGIGTGINYLWHHSCSGEIKATIIAAPSVADTLDKLGRTWADDEPAVKGKCASVDVISKDSAQMATALGNDWDTKSNGSPPDVWVPESTVWVRMASNDPDAEQIMPDLQPSIARSPAVLAMPRDMAKSLGWPDKQPVKSWGQFLSQPPTWSNKSWGPFQFRMSDPYHSTAGLLALMAMLDQNDDGEVTDTEQATLRTIKSSVKDYTANSDTSQILGALRTKDNAGPDAVMNYVSAFPALEQDVVSYNQASPKEPLVALYPGDGSADADNPYLILTGAKWTNPDHQAVARKFLEYVRGPEGRKAFLEEGYRDANRVGLSSELDQEHGVLTTVPTDLPRSVLVPESVANSLKFWTAQTRRTNMLLVLDVSGSMKEKVPGTGKTRMALAKESATKALENFSSDVRVGLWRFSEGLNGAKDYAPVVPIASMTGGQRDRLRTGINGLQPAGATGLYDTAYAAQQEVLRTYQPGATNVVVLLTDGKNEDGNGGLSLAQVVAKLKAKTGNKKVQVITIGFGKDADQAALRSISAATGAQAYSAAAGFDIDQVFNQAIFGSD
jgi:Ca-activated chloride channel family protein